MKNPNTELQKEIFEKLSGALFYEYQPVPVYDRVPNREWDSSRTYDLWVHIAEPIITPFQASKDGFLTNITVNLEVVALYEYASSAGGSEAVDNVSNQITELLIKRGGSDLELESFCIIAVNLQDAQTVKGEQDGVYFTGVNNRITYLVQQL